MDDKALMREFYKSGASNFATFKRARQQQIQQQQQQNSRSPVSEPAHPANASLLVPDAATPNTSLRTIPASEIAAMTEAAPKPISNASAVSPADASSHSVITSPATKKNSAAIKAANIQPALVPGSSSTRPKEQPPLPPASLESSAERVPPTEASPEYITFLKQQQDLQKCHQRLEEFIQFYARDRQNAQANIAKVRSQAGQLLSELEQGTNWNLVSKYTVQSLIRDAQLKLQPKELYQPTDKPQYLDVIQQMGNLSKLMKDYNGREAYEHFALLFDNASKRLERIEKEVKNCQLDTTAIARLPDTLFIQLEHVLGSPTIEQILQDNELQTEEFLFKLEEVRKKLARSLEDGEMELAEEQSYDCIRLYDGVLKLTLDKINTTERIKKEQQVFDKVRAQYQQKIRDEVEKIKLEKEHLKQRCENDLKKVFQLKERVDAVESQTVLKLKEDEKASDNILLENTQKMEQVWSRVMLLEQDLENLENERYQEVKKRVMMKEKDEHRRMEFEIFSKIVQQHSMLLDLTVRNCDTAVHITNLLGETVDTGFTTLGVFLQQQDIKLRDLLLNIHKQHLEHFRNIYLQLGEICAKKRLKIQEIESAIQQAHVNQKLAEETFNPNAKKYSEAKKQLLVVRDQTDTQLHDLEDMARAALENFKVSEEALHDAGVQYAHPVIEQQAQHLEKRAKLAEYKAITMSAVDAQPIKQALNEIKTHIKTTKEIIKSAPNQSQLRLL